LKSDFAGHIFECYAISEIAKGYLNAGKMLNMFYIKTIDPNNNKNNNTNFENHKNGEIDLIIEGKGGILYPIEIKMNMTPQFKYFENIKLLSSIKNKKIAPMTLICSVPSSQTLGPNKLVLPVYWL
jgi:beta-galactosidase beta subunit